MARRHQQHEEHLNHEAWAIPYGDLLTLLLACVFFCTQAAATACLRTFLTTGTRSGILTGALCLITFQ